MRLCQIQLPHCSARSGCRRICSKNSFYFKHSLYKTEIACKFPIEVFDELMLHAVTRARTRLRLSLNLEMEFLMKAKSAAAAVLDIAVTFHVTEQ